MRMVTSIDSDFNYKECETLYKSVKTQMGNHCEFKKIVENSHFYSFYKGNLLAGCIYITSEDGKLFLSGFSVRKNHLKNIEAVKKVVSFYNCSIWAKTKHRSAEIILKKCGFKLIKTDANKIKYLKKED